MDYIQQQVNSLVKEFSNAPYLFVGSGFSRRYLGLEDWEGLLRKFCVGIKDYEYYRSSCDGDFPKTAQEIATDFNKMIWESEATEHIEFLKQHKDELKVSNSALKIAISEYLREFGLKDTIEEYKQEIELLKKVNIEGVITTNWDRLLEELFPDFNGIVGQDELIYSNPFGIAEIFKIHGCSSIPSSLILTETDYTGFNKRNAYLAAKLVTYFVENPVIFIGYSISDENITEILTSIVNCLGEAQINKLSDNFIFVQRATGNEEFTKSIKHIGNAQIPITILKLNDYSKIYQPLTEIKRKIPVRLLRYFREQLYEFVQTNNPKSKIVVVDIEDSTKSEDVEFAIGVGIHKQLAQRGYDRIQIGNLIEDVLFNKGSFDSQLMVEKCIPEIQGNVPIFKYFSDLDDFDIRDLKKSAKKAYSKQNPECFSTKSYKKTFEREWKNKSIEDLFALEDHDKAIRLIPWYKFTSEEEVNDLGKYLKSIYPKYFIDGEPIDGVLNSFFRKIVCLYDLLKFNSNW